MGKNVIDEFYFTHTGKQILTIIIVAYKKPGALTL